LRSSPLRTSFALTDVDLSTVRLTSARIRGHRMVSVKRAIASDTDGDGVAELPAWFSRAGLGVLFGELHGRAVVNAHLEGLLTDHRRFADPVTLTCWKRQDPNSGPLPYRPIR